MPVDIAELSVSITATGAGETNQQLEDIDDTGNRVNKTFGNVGEGAGRLRTELTRMGLETVGVNSHMATLISHLTRFAGFAFGAVAAIGFIALAYKGMTAEAQADEKATQEVIAALDKLGTHGGMVAEEMRRAKLEEELEKVKDPSGWQKLLDFVIDIGVGLRNIAAAVVDVLSGQFKKALDDLTNGFTAERRAIEASNLQGQINATTHRIGTDAAKVHREELEKALNVWHQQHDVEVQALKDRIQYNTELNESPEEYRKAQAQLIDLLVKERELQVAAQTGSQAAGIRAGEEYRRHLELQNQAELAAWGNRVQNVLNMGKRLTVPYKDLARALSDIDKEIIIAANNHNEALLAILEHRKAILVGEYNEMVNATKQFSQQIQQDIVEGFRMAFNGDSIGAIIAQFASAVIEQYAQMMITMAAPTAAGGATATAATPLLSNPFTVGLGLSIIAAALAAVAAGLGKAGKGGGAGGGAATAAAPNLGSVTSSTFNPYDISRAQSLQGGHTTNNFTVIGPNDPVAQRAIVQMVNNASLRNIK